MVEAWTCWLASAFTVVESAAVCIDVFSDWVNDDCDCWLVSAPFPPPALGCDDDCPALDGASFGLRGNKLAFKLGWIANSKNHKNCLSWSSIICRNMKSNLALWSWTAVETRVRSVKLCCLLATHWRRDEHRPAMVLFWRLACIPANVRLMQSLRVAYGLGIPAGVRNEFDELKKLLTVLDFGVGLTSNRQ